MKNLRSALRIHPDFKETGSGAKHQNNGRKRSPILLVSIHAIAFLFINGGDTWSENGELMRLSAGATEAEMLVEGLKRPEYLQVDDDHIYITAYSPDESGFDTGVVYRLER